MATQTVVQSSYRRGVLFLAELHRGDTIQTSYAVPFPLTVICINAAPIGAALVYNLRIPGMSGYLPYTMHRTPRR